VTGFDPRTADIAVGTSSGSIVASIVRAGIGTEELRERVLATGPDAETDDPLDAVAGRDSFRFPAVWRGPAAFRLLTSELRRGRRVRLSNLVLGVLPEGRVSTSPLRSVIDTFHDHRWPVDHLWIPATALRSGRRIIFGRDRTDIDVATAVQASCAIPAYFEPVEIDGVQYIDGGMRSPDNADLLVGCKLDVVVVSSPLSIDEPRLRRSPVLSVLRAYPSRRLELNVAALRAAGTEVLVLEPGDELVRSIGINAMSPSKLRPVVELTAAVITDRLKTGDGLDEYSRRARDLLIA